MIKVSKDRNAIIVIGHAEFDVEGKDIVCAGVSASAQLLGDILKGITEAKTYKRKGELYISYKKGKIADVVVDKFMEQMVQIQSQYPEYIRVENA